MRGFRISGPGARAPRSRSRRAGLRSSRATSCPCRPRPGRGSIVSRASTTARRRASHPARSSLRRSRRRALRLLRPASARRPWRAGPRPSCSILPRRRGRGRCCSGSRARAVPGRGGARCGGPVLRWLAVAADPWPGAVAVWRSGDGASFALHRIVGLPAMIGRTLTALPPGPLWRWDPLATAEVELSSGALASIGDEAVLAGGNLFAVQGPDGCWEIFSAARAELIGARRYRLSRLLRGLAGREAQGARGVPSGATIVCLDGAATPLAEDLADLGRPWRYRIGPASRDYADSS